MGSKVNSRHAFALTALMIAFCFVALPIQHSSAQTTSFDGRVITNSSAAFTNYIAIYIPNSVIANSLVVNVSAAGNTYSLIEINKSSYNNIVIINTTGGSYSFIENNATAFVALRNYLISTYFPNSTTINELSNELAQYQTSAAFNLNLCLESTGLNNYLCTTKDTVNGCMALTCRSVPLCGGSPKGLTSLLNTPGPYNVSIYNFSLQYGQLNSTYIQFKSTVNAITQQNVGTSITTLQSDVSTLAELAAKMPISAIMPLPSNITVNQQQAQCPQYVPPAGPWWCYAGGYCPAPGFNSIVLGHMSTTIDALAALPLTNSSIQAVSSQAAANGAYWYEPEDTRNDTIHYGIFINSTMPSYNALTTNMSIVISRYGNSVLIQSLSTFKAGYTALVTGGIDQNFTNATIKFNQLSSNTVTVYRSASAIYTPVLQQAQNATAHILVVELDYAPGTMPYQVANLANQQANINLELQKQVNDSQLASIKTQIANLSKQAMSLSAPFSLAALDKQTKGGILTSLLSGTGNPYPSVLNSTASLIDPLITFVIGLVIVAIIYFATYHRLASKKRINITPRVKRAWMLLFALLIIIVLIATFVSYSNAQSASQFLPVGLFLGNAQSAATTYIFVNKSIATNAQLQSCLSSMKSTLAGLNKVMQQINITRSAGHRGCVGTFKNQTGTQCYDKIVASGAPAVVIDNLSTNQIVHEGLYGSVLYADGSAVMGSYCPLNEIFKTV